MGGQRDKVETCAFGGGRFELSGKGVHFIGKDDNGHDKAPLWICSPLRVSAMTRNAKSGAWGRLLEWHDNDGNGHQWSMPMELLEGDGVEVRKELTNLGLHLAAGQTARNLFAAYLKVWPVEARALCADRLGWHGKAYLLPDRAIQQEGEPIVFQNAHGLEPSLAQSGTLDAWRSEVASLAFENSRLTFSICLALAGPLAGLMGEDSGGFHLRGASSIGKSTALHAAASVWGKPVEYVRLWRTTTNGLEGLAALHNDCLLILDEIGQIEPGAAGEAAYLLGNGIGKSRASRNGIARLAQRWRVLFLSAGEVSLAMHMQQAGHRASAGQEIRLADIEADAGASLGLFETLHGRETPAEFANVIKAACGRSHGTAGMAWLTVLAHHFDEVPGQAKAIIEAFQAQVPLRGASGQVSRVAYRFALVAAAGELASSHGITGWPQGAALCAALACFRSWLDGFGVDNREDRAILAHARAFLEVHGASRFDNFDSDHDQRVINRAGYYRTNAQGEREFLMPRTTFIAEICKGNDEKAVKRALIEAGMLQTSKEGRPAQSIRLPGLGPSRVYVLRYMAGE